MNCKQKPKRRYFDWSAFRDIAAVVAVLVVVKQSLLSYTQLYAGPVSTLMAMILATLLLHKRGSSWRALGLRWPNSWSNIAALTVFSMMLFIIFTQAMSVVADRYFEDLNYGSRFDHIEGNLQAYLIVMLLVWTHGSFFEELLFRAFAITRLSEFLGGKWHSDLVALFLSSAFFGYRHAYYQGIHGALVTGAGGFAFGLLYLWFGRSNILPLIFAHGVFNTLGQTFRFFGIEDID